MLQFFRHPLAEIDSGAIVGARTRVWAFSHICKGVIIGEDCNLCDHTFVESGAIIGNRVTLKCGVYLWEGITVEDDVFIGPNATFTNDARPRSKQYPPRFYSTRLLQGCSIGANATILPGLTIGRWAMIGAGSVVTRDVPNFGLALGNPARFTAWICRCGEKLGKFLEKEISCRCGRIYRQNEAQSIEEKLNGA